MSPLSRAEQDYIKTIFALAGKSEGAHVSDVARRLGISKASVSVAMKRLEQKNLITRDIDRKIYLTQEGSFQAVCISHRCDIIKNFLLKVLEINRTTASIDACAMEHVVSTETICSMCRAAGHIEKTECVLGGCNESNDT